MQYADLPLHYGNAPRWLFNRMVRLAAEISNIIVEEFGTKNFLERISNPFWFQAFSCVLGFDWHSSGTTTVTIAALKEALKNSGIGIAVCGGKGRTAKATLQEIKEYAKSWKLAEECNKLILASRASAKTDSAALQDGFDLYHHAIIFDKEMNWCVVQQGLNTQQRYARRYHWYNVDLNKFCIEPHSAICSDLKASKVINLTSRKSNENKKTILDLVREKNFAKRISKLFVSKQRNLFNWNRSNNDKHLVMPRNINWAALREAYELQPKKFEELLMIKGFGKSTVRALALISELIYGCEADWRDPVKYSFTVGGKDGVPFPVDRKLMDRITNELREAIENAKLGNKEKLEALKRLHNKLS
ncbi:MAG: DUF763 domain-containing protein [Candidatus Diapherotrites archaeon]|nr:DUF763 domain-containing protein [Candidatus Diapherotrites archaeon]